MSADSVRHSLFTALKLALEAANESAVRFRAPTIPNTPLPRPRRWVLGTSRCGHRIVATLGSAHKATLLVTMPDWGPTGELQVCNDAGSATFSLLEALRHQPKLVLRAIRRLEAAAAWADRMAQVRARQAERILADQASAMGAIEDIVALEAMARPEPSNGGDLTFSGGADPNVQIGTAGLAGRSESVFHGNQGLGGMVAAANAAMRRQGR
jgi:hypothetical protein